MASYQQRGERSFLLTVEKGYTADGKRDRDTKTIRIEDDKLLRTKKRLEDHLDAEWHKFKIEVEAGAYISPEKMTLEKFIPEWDQKYAVDELSETTQENYWNHIENHILPGLGHKRLDKLTTMEVIDFLENLERKDGKPGKATINTKQYVRRVLRSIFNAAVAWKVINEKDNPVAPVKKPKKEKSKRKRMPNVFDEDEVAILFEAAMEELPHWRITVTLALAASLRRGELLGLEIPHYSQSEEILDIQQTIVRGRHGKPVIKGPKSDDSYRIVGLSPSVILDLDAYIEHWYAEREKFDDQWIEHEHEFLLCNTDGTHFYPTTPTTWWRRFTKRAGVRHIRLHDLRHTSATLLINQGVHAKIISERLGHSDIQITMNTYGHALRSADKTAAAKIDHIFAKRDKK